MSNDCNICDFNSDSELGLKMHYAKSHTKRENPYKVERECKQCENIFYLSKSEMQRDVVTGNFCSSKCQGKYERNGKDLKCKNCNSIFHLPESRLEHRSGDFCSKSCLSEYNTTLKKCENCENNFRIHKSEDRRNRGGGRYCSIECVYKSGREDSICDNCNEKFTHPKCNRNGKNIFCTQDCYWEHKFKSGNLRKKSEYNDWRKSVKDRDNNKCVDCGSEINLHAHHIVPISEDKSKAFDLENGVTVCVECHADRHKEMGDPVEKLIRNGHRKS